MIAIALLVSFLPSGQLVNDVPLAALVDKLAQATTIEGDRVGYGGESSETFALARRIADAASLEQAQALLQHQSPVVRGYLAKHVIENLPAALPAVYPLLADSTHVNTLYGCIGSGETISKYVLDHLRAQAERPEVQALLLRAAYDPQLGDLRAEALEAVAKQRPAAASALAKGLLQDANPALLPGAIRALGLAQSSEVAPVLCGLARHAKSEVRQAVADALGSLKDNCAEPTLRKLAADSEPYVRMYAGPSYARSPQRDLAVLRTLLRDHESRVSWRTGIALAGLTGPQDLLLLRDYFAGKHDEVDGVRLMEELAKTRNGAVTAFMREELTSVLRPSASERATAVGYLRDAADRQSLPIFMRALHSNDLSERMAGAEGIAAIDGRSAIPALEKVLLEDDNPHGRLAAAHALVALHSVDAREKILSAAEAESGWAKEELTKLAAELR
jgi:HEAT repeat protein